LGTGFGALRSGFAIVVTLYENGDRMGANKGGRAKDDSPVPFLRVLLADVDEADDQLKAKDTQSNRRVLVRTFFSLVEGTMFPFRRWAIHGLQLSLQIATANAERSEQDGKHREFYGRKYDELKDSYLELAALDEVRLRPNEDGYLIKQPNRNPTIALVALSLRAYARHQRLGYDCQHRFKRAGWKYFKAATKIRNRLTHPTRLGDLKVSDAEIKTLRKAMRWFSHTVLDITQAHKRGLRPATRQDFAAARREAKKRGGGQ
jgi:hypothetical protein